MVADVIPSNIVKKNEQNIRLLASCAGFTPTFRRSLETHVCKRNKKQTYHDNFNREVAHVFFWLLSQQVESFVMWMNQVCLWCVPVFFLEKPPFVLKQISDRRTFIVETDYAFVLRSAAFVLIFVHICVIPFCLLNMFSFQHMICVVHYHWQVKCYTKMCETWVTFTFLVFTNKNLPECA